MARQYNLTPQQAEQLFKDMVQVETGMSYEQVSQQLNATSTAVDSEAAAAQVNAAMAQLWNTDAAETERRMAHLNEVYQRMTAEQQQQNITYDDIAKMWENSVLYNPALATPPPVATPAPAPVPAPTPAPAPATPQMMFSQTPATSTSGTANPSLTTEQVLTMDDEDFDRIVRDGSLVAAANSGSIIDNTPALLPVGSQEILHGFTRRN